MEKPRGRPGQDTGQRAQGGGGHGRHVPDEQGRDDACAEAEGAVHGEVEPAVEAIAQEDAEGERRENEADRRGPDEQVHGRLRRPA